MSASLQPLVQYLTSQYKSRLGISLPVCSPTQLTNNGPALCWQNADLGGVESESEATGVVLIDPEIGLCLFVQQFEKAVDTRSQISRALRFRSRLQPSRDTANSDVDQLGEWRVALHWLVEPRDFEEWVAQVSELRQETAHFEEVPVDAVVNWDDDWSPSIKAHGLPRLLLHVREVIRRGNLDEATAWADADNKISDKVREISNRTATDIQRRYAEQVISRLESLRFEQEEDVCLGGIEEPIELNKIYIENFRNIKNIGITLREKDEIVSSNVIQGPNGSGKSSAYEAISIALSGVSSRYVEFVRDTNVSNRKTSEFFLTNYIASLWRGTGRPRLGINDNPAEHVELVGPDEAENAQRVLNGNFLSQAFVDSLLHMGADELGAEVAGNYSRVANKLYDFCTARLDEAKNKRIEFNQSWGLRSNVSKEKTARDRISESVISKYFALPTQFIRWSRNEAFDHFEGLRHFAGAARGWEELQEKRDRVISRLSLSQTHEEIVRALREYSQEYNRLCSRSLDVLNEAMRRRETIYENLIGAIEAYGNWLAARDERIPSDTGEGAELKEEISSITTQLDKITKSGTAFRNRTTNIQSAIKLFQDDLHDIAPDNCPTCNTDLSDKGGVLTVLGDVLTESETEVERLRTEYRNLSERRNRLRAELGRIGESAPPLDEGELTQLQEALTTLLGAEVNLAAALGDADRRAVMLDAVREIQRLPTGFDFSLGQDGETRAVDGAREIARAFEEFKEVSEAPEAWGAVQKLLLDAFVEALLEHLPRTVQAVWLELSRNMMPAPWQYPGDARFDIEHRRGRPEARIVIRGADRSPLARHILNGAEVHNLALSWFLVRYLTSGRFRYRLLVLDDPAQQMDQPTFRDMCRLLDTLLRLHKHHSIPLTLILLLHQDERALDAARATNGTLHLMRWNRGTPALTRSMKIRSAIIAPPTAYAVLQEG